MRTKFIAIALFVSTIAGCGDAPPLDEEKTGSLTTLVAPSQLQVQLQPPRQLPCGLRLLMPPGAFNFDDGTDDGWQVTDVFDGDSSTVLTHVGTQPAPFWDYTNAPNPVGQDPVDGHGSLVGVATAGGMPSAPSGWWRRDVDSPDLSANGAWQGHGNISYAVLDDMTFAGPALQTQLVLDVVKCDGTTALYRQVDASGNSVFCAATPGSWTTCSASVNLTGVNYIRHVDIRIFGRSGFLYEGGVYVDQVQGH
jgi:hypothetical protein